MFVWQIVGNFISLNLSHICSSKCVWLSTRARAGYPDVSTHTNAQPPKTQCTFHTRSAWLHSFSIILPGRMSCSTLTRSKPALSLRINCPLYQHFHKDPPMLSFSYCLSDSPTVNWPYTLAIHCHSLPIHTHTHNTDRKNSITWADWLKIHNLPFSQGDTRALIETSPKYSPPHFIGFCCTWYTAVAPLTAPNIHLLIFQRLIDALLPFHPDVLGWILG